MRTVAVAAGHKIIEYGMCTGFMHIGTLALMAGKTHLLLAVLLHNRVFGLMDRMAVGAGDTRELMRATRPVAARLIFMASEATLVLDFDRRCVARISNRRFCWLAVLVDTQVF